MTYSLLLYTAKPPGRTLPAASPGHGSVARIVKLSATGSYTRTTAVAVVSVAAEPPTV